MCGEKDIMVSCRKCNVKVPASQLKMDLDEKLMVCANCLKSNKSTLATKKVVVPTTQKEESTSSFTSHSKPSNEPLTAQKIKHSCKSCGYNFNVNMDNMTPRNCPYCGKPVFS